MKPSVVLLAMALLLGGGAALAQHQAHAAQPGATVQATAPPTAAGLRDLEATKSGSQPGQDAALKKLTDNAGEIATFLSGANPYLPRDTVRGLLVAHGGHHVQEMKQLKGQQSAEEARTWDAMRQHMYVIADAIAGALVKQFPNQFSGGA